MLSFQEMVNKTEDQRHNLKRHLGRGVFHPDECSIFHGLKPADYIELKEAYNRYTLAEFLAKSGTTGIAGAAYLIPDKVHDTLIAASYKSDKVPLFAAQVVNGWPGGKLLVDIAVRKAIPDAAMSLGKWSLHPKQFSSGGKMPVQTVETVQATLEPKGFSVHPNIGIDLVEDAMVPDLVEWHVKHAAQQIGQYATDLALLDITAHADGDGTALDITAGADTTTSSNIFDAVEEMGSGQWNPDTLICTHKAWVDAICVTASSSGVQFPPPPEGYDAKFQMLDVILNNSSSLYDDVVTLLMTECDSIVLDRSAALLCGRKRWMKIENYGDPVRDLATAVVSCRQDCVTLYKDAICTIEEA